MGWLWFPRRRRREPEFGVAAQRSEKVGDINRLPTGSLISKPYRGGGNHGQITTVKAGSYAVTH